jgi:hypothetical protein
VAKSKVDPSAYVVKDILKSSPKSSPEEVRYIVECARKFGGTDDSLSEPLLRFMGAFKPPGRTVAEATWKSLAQLKFATDDLCPNFIMSILMALAAAPTENFISAAEIKGLVRPSKVAEMKECEELIKQGIEVCLKLGVTLKINTKHLGEFRTSLVFKCLDKVKALKKHTFKSIAFDFFEHIKGKAMTNYTALNPWVAHALAPGQQDVSQKNAVDTRSQVVDYGSDGKARGVRKSLLLQKGFDDNRLIKVRKTGVRTYDDDTRFLLPDALEAKNAIPGTK